MKKIAIVNGVRTPFIKAWDAFDDIPAQGLGVLCVKELLKQTGLDGRLVDEVVLGCVGQPVEAANVARVVSLLAGIPQEKRACTVSRNCASGFESVIIAAEKIRCGSDEVVIAGGAESMSNMPMLFRKEAATLFRNLSKAKTLSEKFKILIRMRPRHFAPVSSLVLGLTDPVCGLAMGQTAEMLAKEFAISREEQDRFALESHRRAAAAKRKLHEETMDVFISSDRRGCVREDNGIRENQTLAALTNLKPIFEKKTGTVTAGNASQISDGACALLLMSEEKAKSLGCEVLGTLRDHLSVGLEPSRMGLGPALAISRILERNSLKLDDIDLFEINEAFAVQVLACLRALACPEFAKRNFSSGAPVGMIPREILNVNGGAIALGHPVGTSGARLILTCLKEMKRRSLKRGLVSACVGGGQGTALILERGS
ncbi:MAG TPA: thiolase family protein [Candidatus Omnitrophota bacterium]|nr:thiolase family protein [Candidatus Omnitrophota bacterium]HPS36711.1 thiolase family protein [Candidatus Omnitrophota bacterium]